MVRTTLDGRDTVWFPGRVFISYKTREHHPYVEEIAAALEAEGQEVWLDRKRPIPPWQAMGLDFFLKRGLNQADALLYLVPDPEQPPQSLLQRWKDGLDFWLTALFVSVGLSPGFWYALWLNVFYGKDVFRSPLHLLNFSRTSWQAWEERVGKELGLLVLRVSITREEAAKPPDPADVIPLRADHLSVDLKAAVLPRISQGWRIPLRLRTTVRTLGAWALISFGVFLGVAASVLLTLLVLLVRYLVIVLT
jgi:hypothetical protein